MLARTEIIEHESGDRATGFGMSDHSRHHVGTVQLGRSGKACNIPSTLMFVGSHHKAIYKKEDLGF